ncbi:MAG: hypothetical protein EKK57_01025, partial [Proteobacteria bacterium]
HTTDGKIIACTEKIKVMRENLEELNQSLVDAFEDAILMDIDPIQVKNFLIQMMQNLDNPYESN